MTQSDDRRTRRRGAAPPAPRADHDLGWLLRESARGDESAFAALYDRTAARGYGVALTILGDAAAADEVATQAYLDIWSRCARFDPTRDSPISWILGITRQRAVARVRSARSRFETSRPSPPQYDDALDLAYRGGYTCSEIAVLLGSTPDHVAAEIRACLLRRRVPTTDD